MKKFSKYYLSVFLGHKKQLELEQLVMCALSIKIKKAKGTRHKRNSIFLHHFRKKCLFYLVLQGNLYKSLSLQFCKTLSTLLDFLTVFQPIAFSKSKFRKIIGYIVDFWKFPFFEPRIDQIKFHISQIFLFDISLTTDLPSSAVKSCKNSQKLL